MPTIALYSWPVITLVLFARLGPARGLIWSVILGYLFLPEQFFIDFPALPPLNKFSVVPLSALLATFVYDRRPAGAQAPKPEDPFFRTMFWIFLVLVLISPVGTVLTNTEPLVYGPNTRPALGFDGIRSMFLESFFTLVPLFLAMRLLHDPRQHTELMRALVLAGGFYTLLVLFEIRMSPQLHNWVYGFFPHTWGQHLRGGGYRPVVFLDHGLSLGFFLFTVTLAAFGLAREMSWSRGTLMTLAGFGFLAVLAVSSNTGALMLGLLFAPVILFTSRRVQIRVAAVVAIIFLAYPAFRLANLVPLVEIVETIEERISTERAGSLAFRLANEDLLLEHFTDKPIFGWGGWSRWRVYNDQGEDQIIADGTWIITLGERGWAGYLGTFGLMTLPMLLLARARRRRTVPATTVAMSLITAGNLIYLVPNSTLSPIAVLMMGAMAGFVQATVRDYSDNMADPALQTAQPQSGPVYTRFRRTETSPAVRERRPSAPVRRTHR